MNYRNWEINIMFDCLTDPTNETLVCGLRRLSSNRAIILRRRVRADKEIVKIIEHGLFSTHEETANPFYHYYREEAKEEAEKEAIAIVDFIEDTIQGYEQGAIDAYKKQEIDRVIKHMEASIKITRSEETDL